MLRGISGPWLISLTSRRSWVMSSRQSLCLLFSKRLLQERIQRQRMLRKRCRRWPPKPKEVEAPLEEEAPKPKVKNPLDLLPPSKMILDEWKRLYSNTNTKTNFREVAIKGISSILL
jgi:hypothetical protein